MRTGWLVTLAGFLAVIGIVASAMLMVGLWQSRNRPFSPTLDVCSSQQDTNAYTLSTSHMLDLSYASFAALRLPAALAAVALLLAPLMSIMLRLRQRHYSATWVLAAGLAVFLVAAHIALGRFGPYLSSKQLAQQIAARARPEDKVIDLWRPGIRVVTAVYLRRPIDLVEGRTTSMWFGSTFADAPKIYLTDADLQRYWAGARGFLFVPPYEKTKVDGLLPEKSVVGRFG